MFSRLSHVTVWVLDQDRALAFYTDKLGLEVRTDARMGAFRWLTLGVPGQPELEIVLMEPKAGPMMDEAAAAKLRSLVEAGQLGGGVFNVEDCRKSYAELSARGVTFRGEPKEQPYGVEALFQDDSGNWFSMTQRTA